MRQSRYIQRTRSYRETKANVLSNLFLGAVSLTLLVALFQGGSAWYASRGVVDPLSQPNIRKLLECTTTSAPIVDPDEPYEIIGADYPTDVFTQNQLESGALILHFIGLMYMFLAIAIVCDEFFVPAIEVIVDALNLSPDVAGATFMAAGGSAPELFTAFIGTFISKSDVGFGAIVGSAVFNVLFVIGCCAIFSGGDLVLTWYPFARDCTYYCISLVCLAGFFSDQFIYWWEATILLLLYVGYVILMFNNAKLYNWIDLKFLSGGKSEAERKKTAAEQLRPPQAIQSFSVSLFKMMTADANISEIAGIHMVARIRGDVKATFRQVDTDNSGFIDKAELRAVLQKLGGDVSEEEVEKCYAELDENDDGQIDFEEFSRWYLKSENRIESDVESLFNKFDHDNNGHIEIDELENLVAACQGGPEKPTAEEVEKARKILDSNDDGQISKAEFMAWYKSSKFFEQQKQRRDTMVEAEAKEEEEGISLAFPENCKGRIMYLISAPIMFSLYFTVPDVRKAKWTSWWPLAFIMSIVWLAVYSLFMVWWATTLGRVIGISDGIMGLTVLAAGTSVPDLLTSVIVAKAGNGDMAVSSSIGSNIFDVLIGLPLPWFFAAALSVFDDGKIEVVADSLFVSILILFAMLGAVLAIIACSKWRMTKTLGYAMFVLYLLFCVQDIARQELAGDDC